LRHGLNTSSAWWIKRLIVVKRLEECVNAEYADVKSSRVACLKISCCHITQPSAIFKTIHFGEALQLQSDERGLHFYKVVW